VIQKRSILRSAADRDVREAIEFYLTEGAQQAALKFIDALEQALNEIENHPGIGSTRYAHELDLPDLRFWQLKGYPYVLFYIEREDHVDVWRVLHGSRDIPSWLQTAD
jgi:toxin ParE1/3/4